LGCETGLLFYLLCYVFVAVEGKQDFLFFNLSLIYSLFLFLSFCPFSNKPISQVCQFDFLKIQLAGLIIITGI